MLSIISSLSNHSTSLHKPYAPPQDLSPYPATYNLAFTKTVPEAASLAYYNPQPDKLPNWNVGQNQRYFRSTFNGLTNFGTDEEHGCMGFWNMAFNELRMLTHLGFPLNAGTYYFTFRCGASGGTSTTTRMGISIEYSINNGSTYTSLYYTGTPYYNTTTNTDMYHPSTLHTTPNFTINTHIPNFIIRFSNINNIGPTSGHYTAVDDIQIHTNMDLPS